MQVRKKNPQQNPGLALIRRWQGSGHNLPLIIYTAWLTVLMQRPEKIQATNLICTQTAEERNGEEKHGIDKRVDFSSPTLERNTFANTLKKKRKTTETSGSVAGSSLCITAYQPAQSTGLSQPQCR